MAIIYTYPAIGTPENEDIMLISDVSLDSNATRNITLSSLAAFINAKVNLSTAADTGTGIVNLSTQILSVIGTANEIETSAVNQTIQIGLPDSVTITNNLTVGGDFTGDRGTFTGTLSVGDDLTVSGLTETDTLQVAGAANFEGDTRFFGKLLDTVQGVPGYDGSILTSTGTGVAWKGPGNIPNNVSGEGSNLTIPMWYGATPTSNLADSTIALRLVSPGAANPYSLQFGGNSQATGTRNSVALGYATTAAAEATLATGHGTTASGLHAASFNFGTTASGEKSAAFGDNTVASGKNSFAIGANTTAATSLSFAGGKNSIANPDVNFETAFAYGDNVSSTGNNSAAFGKGTVASGERAFVTGNSNSAQGLNSAAFGGSNSAIGDLTFVAGYGNQAVQSGSVAIGTNNNTGGYPNVTAIGVGLRGHQDEQVVLGKYNSATNDKFVVGNGSNGNLKNGLQIGNTSIKIPDYGLGTVTGTVAYNLAVDANGKIIETSKAGAPDYLSFVCLLSQSGTANPQPNIVLENSLGVASAFTAFTRVSGGEYNLNAPGKFKLLKTIVFINGGSAENNHDVAWEVIDADNLRIRTHNSDGKLTKASLEIRTYN